MSWSTNTVWASHNMRHRWLMGAAVLLVTALSHAEDGNLRAPSNAVAGTAASIATTGSGTATFYLIGPSISLKREITLGQEVSLAPKELQSAGRYIAIVCAANCQSAEFFVTPAKPNSLTFLVHPSRAPAGERDVISGVTMPLDEFHNLILAPTPVAFQLTARNAAVMSHSATTQDGIAWFRTNSGKSAGPLQVTASINDVSARRVVQQVASDPCSLRIKGQRTTKGIAVETETVRDCAGNPVPDGTVVTFTAKDGKETSTVDAPIKQGVARAQMLATGPVVISAASGVVMGNELRLGAQ